MSEREHLISLIDLMCGLSQNEVHAMASMEIKELENKYILLLQEKNDEMRMF